MQSSVCNEWVRSVRHDRWLLNLEDARNISYGSHRINIAELQFLVRYQFFIL